VIAFKDLCIDAVDARAVAPFWASAIGLAVEYQDNGDAVLRGTEPGRTVWINTVPETKTVKNRVHLDLHTDSVDTLAALGATVLPEQNDEDRWTVMADPEGNELCAFVHDPDKVPAYKGYALVVDSADPDMIGGWWADRFEVELGQKEGSAWRWLDHVPGFPMELWLFIPVPEAKTVKNRMHWDLYGDVADFEGHGATPLWTMPHWTVLADPEGNEFCVFPPPET
jgi:hypothetical protein